MFRIDSQGTVPALPAPDAPGQLAGFFSKGNPAVGQKATVVSADWANAMQEEICYVIEQAGIQLNQAGKNNHVQLKAAITTMIGVVAPAPHTHDAADIVSGTFADARIASSNVTQYQANLILDAAQTTSGVFADARIPNLDTSKITSGTFADARIAQSNITQHNAALDHGVLQGLGDDDHPQYAHLNKGGQTFNQKVHHPSTGGGDPGNTIATKDYVDAHAGVTDHGALSGLGDDDHTQYLHLNKGGQTLQQNLAVAANITVDGVNISAHTHDGSVLLSTVRNSHAFYDNNATQDLTDTEGGFDSSDMAWCSISNLSLNNNNFSSDNHVRIGSTVIQQLSGFDFNHEPNFSGGVWNFRQMTSAGNDSQIVVFCRGVISNDDTFTTGSPN